MSYEDGEMEWLDALLRTGGPDAIFRLIEETEDQDERDADREAFENGE